MCGADCRLCVSARQEGVLVPREVLAEILCLQQQLERAIVANERIRRQLERELPPQDEIANRLQVSQTPLYTDNTPPAAASGLANRLQVSQTQLIHFITRFHSSMTIRR